MRPTDAVKESMVVRGPGGSRLGRTKMQGCALRLGCALAMAVAVVIPGVAQDAAPKASVGEAAKLAAANPTPELSQSVLELRKQVDELHQSLREVLAETASARDEIAALRRELASVRQDVRVAASLTATSSTAASAASEAAQEDADLDHAEPAVQQPHVGH